MGGCLCSRHSLRKPKRFGRSPMPTHPAPARRRPRLRFRGRWHRLARRVVGSPAREVGIHLAFLAGVFGWVAGTFLAWLIGGPLLALVVGVPLTLGFVCLVTALA